MARMRRTVTLTLPDDLLREVWRAVDAGRYPSTSALVCKTLERELHFVDDEALNREIDEAMNDPLYLKDMGIAAWSSKSLMKKTRKAPNFDELIDRFVETVHRIPKETGNSEAIPPSVRGRIEDSEAWSLYYDWSIRPWPNIDWIEPMERKMGVMLPPSFRSLVTRYVFPRFIVGPIQLEANTPEGVLGEFRHLDPAFEEVLIPKGFIPFAKPNTGSYDPICFDTRCQRGAGECAIVRIDHESVLCDGVVGEVADVAPSFAAFVETFVRWNAI